MHPKEERKMKRHGTLAAVLLLGIGILVAPSRVQAQRAMVLAQSAEPEIESPRPAALWQQLKMGNGAALDDFWREIQGKAPLIEPNPANPTKARVTFIQRGGDNIGSILLNGGLPRPDSSWPLVRLPNTDLWYHTERLPADARFTYAFTVLNVSGTSSYTHEDSLNALHVGMWGSGVELPNAPTGPWTRRLPNTPPGKLARRAVKSQALKETRGFTVYTPAGYVPAGGPYGLLVLFDGEWYRDPQLINGPVILDNLIAQRLIAPLVVVMLDNSTGIEDRSRDLGNSPAFADFLAEELVPWVKQNYAVSSDPTRSIVGGLSLGGLMASYCGLRHPGVFGNVLSQDGAYWVWDGYPQVGTPDLATETGWLTRQLAISPKLPLRFSLEVGRLEKSFSIDYPLENRRLRDVLQAKGYPVAYEEINGAHDPLNWRSTLADGLIALAGPPLSP
jgi:enterochelin esterase-like enzyme